MTAICLTNFVAIVASAADAAADSANAADAASTVTAQGPSVRPATGHRRHFDLDAGDAAQMLNEFSRQSDLQVLFDFNFLKGMKTHRVKGNLDASDALRAMLVGTNLVFDFVNDRTLAVTPKRNRPSILQRIWQRAAGQEGSNSARDGLEQVLISGVPENGTQALLGAQTIKLSRVDIDRSGMTTVQDLLRTLPQVFGGGPSEDTLLIGREASTNSARGAGVNLRGLDAGATLLLIDGRRVAPGGTEGTFEDASNIPLSIIDHIDLLPDGAAARYGADAIGGVVNFVTRVNFRGAQTQALAGTVTDGSMGEHQFSQLLGSDWAAGNALLAFEYYQQDALRARDRRQETSDLTPFGGYNFDTPFGNPGNIVSSNQSDFRIWPIPRGQNGTALTAASLQPGAPNLFDPYLGANITPSESRWSAFGKVNERLSDSVSVSAEALLTQRSVGITTSAQTPLDLKVPDTNPFYVNPTGVPGPVEVLYGSGADFGPPAADNRIDTGNFSLGVSAAAPGGWTASGFAGYSFERQRQIQSGLINETALAAALADPNPLTAFNPFGDGSHTNPATLAAIGGTGLFILNSQLRTISLTGSGPTLALPGGDVQLTGGAEYRDQTLDTYIKDPTTTAGVDPNSRLGRRIGALFGELRIPLIAAANSRRFAQRLEMSLGGRYEHYSDVGGAAIPKFGLIWSPVANLSVRSTWSRSIRPPNLPDLVLKDSYSELEPVADPSSPGVMRTVLIRFGKNPSLVPERARSWTMGADATLGPLRGTTLSLTYFDIHYEGRIDEAQLTPDVLQRPDLAYLVNRDFTAAQRADACSHGTFIGPPGDCLDAPIAAIIDNRLRNLTLLHTRGIDTLLKSVQQGTAGKFELGLNATYLFEYSQAVTPTAPLLNIVSTQNNPINLRLRGSASWSNRGVSLTSYLNFDNSYHDTLSVPNRKVASWTTMDMQLSYETNAGAPAWLTHTQFALNVQNLFDTYPPFLNNPVGVGYDQENADLFGRLVSFNVRKRW